MFKKTCLTCGKEFSNKYNTAKYCCGECYHAAKVKQNRKPPADKPQNIRKCETCGKTFEARTSNINAGGGKFCSKSCSGKLPAVFRKCELCGQDFELTASGKFQNQKFCSKKCGTDSLKKPDIFKNCEVCGTEFKVSYRCRLEKGQEKYCTIKCAGIAQRLEKTKLNCLNCNKEFEVLPCRLAQDARYCSQQCAIDDKYGIKPNIIIQENIVLIPLRNDKWAKIDREDYENIPELKVNNWCCSKQGYAKNGDKLSMHRLIMSPPDDMVINHKNFDKLDNRKENLEICTTQENTRYRHKNKNPKTSQYKGVSKENNKWRLQIGSTRRLFETEKEAAEAYNIIAKELYGNFAYLNIIK